MAAYRPDPGGIFASDTHRRVLAHLTPDEPFDLQAFGHRVSADAHHELQSVADLETVLSGLADDGYAVARKDGWKLTDKGLSALQAPLPEQPEGSSRPALLKGLEG